MLFIFGCPRSGTTLLAASLNLHEDIFIPHETDFIVPLAFIYDRVKEQKIGKELIARLITSTKAFDKSLGEILSKDDVWEVIMDSNYLCGDLVSGIFDLIGKKTGKRIVGDKSPNDLQFIRMIIRTGVLDPEHVRVVHIIRDVRDVILSLKRTSWADANVETYLPKFWNYSNLYLYENYRSQTGKYLLIKYENLVTAPRATFEAITDFLRVPFQEKMLCHSNRGSRYTNMEHHRNLAMPFLPERAGAWRKCITPTLREACEKQASEALNTFGYGV